VAGNLVIVESPAKVKTIKKFLGSRYEVAATMGHVRDLPKSSLGIDIENDYEPKYITIRGKGDLLADLRKAAKNASTVYLATDPDREGEAISWHLIAALKLDPAKIRRITFHEITKQAVKNSLKNARSIDMNLVDAQQARRVLDRIVGYEISPLLWSKVRRGLSAGRVQSVALRIIADREKEIEDFIPQEYYTLDADFEVEGARKPLRAHFYGKDKKMTLSSKEEAETVKAAVEGAGSRVAEVKRAGRTRKAPLPFTTSTLQQEAAKVLNFSTSKTMRIAQQLYEGVDIAGEGTIGVITYLRTDSTRIADEADAAARSFIADEYGEKYVGPRISGGNGAQDAHEAIRPTDIRRLPAKIKDSLTRDQLRLYTLIWKRFAGSRMAPAAFDTLSIKLEAGGYTFTASSSNLAFEGFLAVYSQDAEKEESAAIPADISENTAVRLSGLFDEQHFTQPPAHYTEASLVKTLEELGIGRPSTYAPTITTILARRYIAKEKKNLYITELGSIVNDIMCKEFPQIVDVHFTANMELLLDGVAEGKIEWKTIVRNFYPDFHEAVVKADSELSKVEIADEETDVVCENCGRKMVIKYGPHGKFLACPGFPECRNTKPYFEKIGVACPLCGGDVVIKMSKRGRRFYGCSNNPECGFISWGRPVEKRCPKCGGYMVEKGRFLACAAEGCGYKERKE